MKPKLIFVAAVAKNGVIGSHNALPWYIPEDLKRFKELTTSKTVLMGKNTYDSIVKRLGEPLPNRKNIVVTTRTGLVFPKEVVVVNDLDKFLETTKEEEIYVIGGGQIFNKLFDLADKLCLTQVHDDADGDVLFPKVDWSQWNKTFEETHDKFTFANYERK